MNIILRKNGLGKDYLKVVAELIGDTTVVKTARKALRGPLPAVLVRWGSTEELDTPELTIVLNQVDAIKSTSNKKTFRLKLQEAGVSVPKTVVDWNDLRTVAAHVDSSWIIRPSYHAGGKHLLVLNKERVLNPDDLDEQLVGEEMDEWPNSGRYWYASEHIKKDREFRVFIVSGRVINVAEKIPEDREQYAWNHAEGSSFENVSFGNWPIKACIESVKAFNLSGLDFGAVDVIQKENTPYVLEINSAPSLTSRYRQECFAKAIKWRIDGNEVQPVLIERVKGWRRLIHPAISNEARND